MTARISLISILVLSAACTALISCSATNYSASRMNVSQAPSSSGEIASAPPKVAPEPTFFPITRVPDAAPIAEKKSGEKPAATGAEFSGSFQGFGGGPPSAFTKAMSDIGQIFGQFEAVERVGWAPPKNGAEPAAEAGRMVDLLRKLTDGDRARSKPADFAAMMKKSSEEVMTLQQILKAGNAGAFGLPGVVDSKKASAQFKLIAATCNECHTKYRD